MAIYSKALYRNAPVLLQNSIVSAYGLGHRIAKRSFTFRSYIADVEAREGWPIERIREFQNAEIARVMMRAAADVPFYRELTGRLGFSADNVRGTEDLIRLPVIDKNTFRAQPAAFVSENVSGRNTVRAYTSGTSGTPLALRRTFESVQREHAFMWRQFRWAGARLGDRIAVLRGDLVVPATQRTAPFWRRDYFGNRLLLSSYHLSDAAIPQYLNALRAFQPVIIYAYPSSIHALAEYILRTGTKPKLTSLRGIVTSSETLLPEQRERITAAFGCSVFDWYGQGERVIFIGTCPAGSQHVFEDYGYTEFLPLGENRYQLVGTGFINEVIPFMRYRTGDVVELDEHGSCSCGSAFRTVKKVEGRLGTMIRFRNGTMLGPTNLVFWGLEGIREAQIIQNTYEDFTIRVVLDPVGTHNGVLEKLRHNFHLRAGSDVRLAIDPVPAIERTASGKFEAVICRLNHETISPSDSCTLVSPNHEDLERTM